MNTEIREKITLAKTIAEEMVFGDTDPTISKDDKNIFQNAEAYKKKDGK